MPSFLPKPCSTPVSTPFPLLLLLPATGVGSWERPQLMEHGAISSEALCSGALPHSRQRHCPTLHPPAVGQIPALRKQRAAVPKSLLCLSLEQLPVPTPSIPACCNCRNAASSQHCPRDSSCYSCPASCRETRNCFAVMVTISIKHEELSPCFSGTRKLLCV